MAVSTQLDDRYGRTRNRSRRDRRTLWIAGSVFAVVLAAWVIWAGLDGAKPVIDARDLAYTVVDDRTVSVTFSVSMPAGTTSSCAVEALNESFTVVGWKVVDIPPSDRFTRAFTETVRTSELATTGLIYQSWLT
jgi:hypothetical protein